MCTLCTYTQTHKLLKLKRANKTCLAKISMIISNDIKCTSLLNTYIQNLAVRCKEIVYSWENTGYVGTFAIFLFSACKDLFKMYRNISAIF